jgi:hypothetical protein
MIDAEVRCSGSSPFSTHECDRPTFAHQREGFSGRGTFAPFTLTPKMRANACSVARKRRDRGPPRSALSRA